MAPASFDLADYAVSHTLLLMGVALSPVLGRDAGFLNKRGERMSSDRLGKGVVGILAILLCATVAQAGVVILPPYTPYSATIATDKPLYALGEQVMITQILTNTTDEDIELTFSSAPGFNVVVYAGDNEEPVWSYCLVYLAYNWTEILPAREQIENTYTWDLVTFDGAPVAAGNYRIVGEFFGPYGPTAEVEIAVVPEPGSCLTLFMGTVAILRRRRA
jgi:hypothetical protein